MSVIYFLIGIGIIVAGGFLLAFIWAVKSGQYDDDYTPSDRMLFDDFKPDSNLDHATTDSSEMKKTKDVEKSNNN
jgi:cbb3-type cytochrome oxidase maturation protein